MEQNRSAYSPICFWRKSLGEYRPLLQLLQCIRHGNTAALEFDWRHDELSAAFKHKDNEVASLAPLPMSLEGLVRINDDALTGHVL